jgi:hypothetical protein
MSELPPPPPGKTGWPWTIETHHRAEIDKNYPKISIITPSYDQGAFIEETIRSVLLQGYPNLEFIIMDGGSADGSVEIIKKYQDWLAFWVSEKDSGQTDAINKGLSRASGQYLNWLNSDDLLLPGALLAIAEISKLENDIDIITGARFARCTATNVEYVHIPWLEQWPFYVCGYPDLPQETTFFSDKILNLAKPLDERMEYYFDTAFHAEALRFARKVAMTSAAFGVMHMYPEQKTARYDPSKVWEMQLLQSYFPSGLATKVLYRLAHTRLTKLVQVVLPMIYRSRARAFLRVEYDFLSARWCSVPKIKGP